MHLFCLHIHNRKYLFVNEKGEKLKQQGKKYREEHKEDIAKYREVLGEDKMPDSLKKMIPGSKSDVIVTYEEREMLETARGGMSLIPLDGSKKQILSVLDGQNTALKARGYSPDD